MSKRTNSSDNLERLIGFGLIASCILVFITSYHGSGLEEETNFIRGINIFSKFSVIFIAFGLFLTYIYYKQNLMEIRRNNTIKAEDEHYGKIIMLVKTYQDSCPYFCSTLFYDWQINKSKKINKASDDSISRNVLACMIFQSIETVITIQAVDTSSPVAWCGVFLQWLHDKDIQKIWKNNSHNYDEESTVVFIDIFIDFINKHDTPKNSKELQKLSVMISEHPKIEKILNP